ncbi:MAG: type I methionyl aminopeptidase [Alphaproteobacteria bacterium]|nr:type I methionyl aminopeptidase [Alphaproteobacteria bacterium]
MSTQSITIYTEADFACLRKAGQLAAMTLDYITPFVKEGVTTLELDGLCHRFILDNGAKSATVGYQPQYAASAYPFATCISLNHVICHGFPDNRRLEKGDIFNLDITVELDGWFGDSSRMYTVGKPKVLAAKLIKATYDAMWRGIDAVRPGAHLGDIGYAIQSTVEPLGFSVVYEFCGHGIGRKFHQAPSVMHIGRKGQGQQMKPGMVFTIEPMINAGKPQGLFLSNGWTCITRDRSLSAQFEHQVGVTKDGYEVFTRSPKGWEYPPYD